MMATSPRTVGGAALSAFEHFVQARWEETLTQLPVWIRDSASRQLWLQDNLGDLRRAFGLQDASESSGAPSVVPAGFDTSVGGEEPGPPPKKRIIGKQRLNLGDDASAEPPPLPHQQGRPKKKAAKVRMLARDGPCDDKSCGAHESVAHQTHGPAAVCTGMAPDDEISERTSFVVRCMLSRESPDPRAALDTELRVLADLLREHPTVPGDAHLIDQPDPRVFDDELAVLLPPKHCAFKGCKWHLHWDENTFDRDRESALVEHLVSAHAAALQPVCALLPMVYTEPTRASAAYSEAIAVKVREGAPLASYSIDRRCLRKYAEATEGDNIQALICFMCACVHPYRAREHFPPVSWCKAKDIFGLYGEEDTERMFGLNTYLANYGADPAGYYDLRRHMAEFDDWYLDVPFGAKQIRVMCCPEDRICSDKACVQGKMICAQCEVPLCAQCRDDVYQERGPVLPPAALSNDMMVFYAPEELYLDGGLTVMEMICASPCITAMICFSMEVKYGHMLDSTTHMHRHRVGARGNATTFLLPWETVLSEMQRLDDQAAANGEAPDLPRTGKDLRYVVQVLLKTSDENKRDDLKHFVHQAKVNRAKVIRCILGMKQRGHRAYVHLDMKKVDEKARQLPENGVPPELITLLPNDNAYDKLRAQKAATPVEGMGNLSEAGMRLREERPNAVVMERSSVEEGDIQLRREASLRALVQKLNRSDDIGQRQNSVESQAADAATLLRSLTTKGIMQLAAEFLDSLSLHACLCTCGAAGHWCTPAGVTKENAQSARDMLRSLRGTSDAQMHRFVLASGSRMENQFVPWYFGVAFAFLFKFCTGMPDMPEWSKVPRHRRKDDAPQVPFPLWVKIMTRRVEQQLRRDWLFGFTMSNVLFRSLLNQCRTVYSYQKARRSDGSFGFTAAELESGAISICRALDGKYKDLTGKLKKVNGDFTKVRYAVNLNEAGKRLLQNLEHTSRQIKGTNEVRKLMRYETNAGRIRRGIPIFITFSPDEKHNVLMLRLHRSRRNDPVHVLEPHNRWVGQRLEPAMDDEVSYVDFHIDEIRNWLPDYDDRRAILARDGLASVDGFQTSILIVCEYFFGMRVCAKCPDCNHTVTTGARTDLVPQPCQNLFGSNAFAEGGSFGVAEGIYISKEAQKSAGSLHAHGQLHVACVHQHTPLSEIVMQSKVVQQYLRYKAHVCREVYEDVDDWTNRYRRQVEEDWPEYRTYADLVSRYAYMRSDMDPKAYLRQYLSHFERVAQLKQHHVHVMNAKGERVPLSHCRRADNPSKCKGDFPRDWLVDEAVVLCQGLMRRWNMPLGGRRNRLASLHGPRNEENVNGTHTVLAAGTGTNTDVQLPYRFPITPETHAAICDEDCVARANLADVIDIAQRSQDAQVGYACDYQNKRAARSCNEVKECAKGIHRLGKEVGDQGPARLGKRLVTRLCSDAYGKGIVRSQQESINLRVGGTDADVTSAESFHTASFVAFPGNDITRWREAVYQNASYVEMVSAIDVDWRNPSRKTPVLRNLVFMYGHRPAACKELWFLSPYEFMVHWTIELAKYSHDVRFDNPDMPARLTEAGIEKQRQKERGESVVLMAGRDYEIKGPRGGARHEWIALPDNTHTSACRHDWVIVRNHRPKDPTFAACPMPRNGTEEAERSAALILSYFHPWTLNPEAADTNVPFLGELCEAGMSWHDSLLHWFDGRVLCIETKRYVDNFLAVTRARPEDGADERSDESISDDELVVGRHNFAKVVKTRMGAGKQGAASSNDIDGENTELTEGQAPEATKEAFDLALRMWAVPSLKGKVSREGEVVIDEQQLKVALAAAASSQKQEFKADYSALSCQSSDPSLRQAKRYSTADLDAWITKTRGQKDKHGQPLWKDAQIEVLRVVSRRMCVELQEQASDVPMSQPLIWLVHGSPGTGKSEVLKLIKQMYADVCGWQMGLQYQMVAFQAVMAQLLGGDTIHHALGINAFGEAGTGQASEKARQRQSTVAERIMQWRWLYIDEISMVSAKLLAEIDMKLRAVVSAANKLKKDVSGEDLPFGGLNVVMDGDFWQLDPPMGGYLAAIPVEFIRKACKYDPKPDVAHGQAIFWGEGKGCVQGMTELTECVRTEDPWLLQVQNEMRAGAMSEDSWNFLHGRKTTVPGSVVDGKLTCGDAQCFKSWSDRGVECAHCQRERRERTRVVQGENDPRLREKRFLEAPSIFPNNDIKCEVNKLRAQIFAAETQQALTWSIAKDKPSNRVLSEKMNITEEKEVWLSRHDRDCAGLYGTLPLAKGLPMMLTEHLDRNPEKSLLKGRIGYVKRWVLDDREDSEFVDNARYLRYPPKALFLQFTEWVYDDKNNEKVEVLCSWVIDGIGEPGVYPIKPCARDWFLDQRRQKPKLGVKRFQLPLAPAYSITAHGSQGQTLRAAHLDLQIGRGVSSIASYVASTRLRKKVDLLIYRSFEREVFTQGEPEGPALLLRKLRGERIDWDAIENKHAPKRLCKGPCFSIKPKADFSEKEWANKEDAHCRACMKRLKEQGKTVRCRQCRMWFGEEDLNVHTAKNPSAFKCKSCMSTGFRSCARCGAAKPEQDFARYRWHRRAADRVCIECMATRSCARCGQQRGKAKFATEEWGNTDAFRTCRDCAPKRCCVCHKARGSRYFDRANWALEEGVAKCHDCDRKRCASCSKLKGHMHFTATMWQVDDGSPQLVCLECSRGVRQRGFWTCCSRLCQTKKPHAAFSKAIQKHGGDANKVPMKTRVCDACHERREQEHMEQQRHNLKFVQKAPR